MKKTVNPKVLVHLTISPDLKTFAIKENINLSELLEEAILDLMKITETTKTDNDLEEFKRDVFDRWKHRGYFESKNTLEDKALLRSYQMELFRNLRTEYGIPSQDAQKIVNEYIEMKKKQHNL